MSSSALDELENRVSRLSSQTLGVPTGPEPAGTPERQARTTEPSPSSRSLNPSWAELVTEAEEHLRKRGLDPAALGINAFSPHNPVIDGNLLYVSWYDAGVQIFDIANPQNPLLIRSFDTYPGTAGTFAGNWGVYPFLGSDRVLVSDIQTGLYVLSVQSPATIDAAMDSLGPHSLQTVVR